MAVNVPVYEKCCYTTATRYKIEKKKRERQAEASLFDPLRARRHEDDGSESGRIENRPCT